MSLSEDSGGKIHSKKEPGFTARRIKSIMVIHFKMYVRLRQLASRLQTLWHLGCVFVRCLYSTWNNRICPYMGKQHPWKMTDSHQLQFPFLPSGLSLIDS